MWTQEKDDAIFVVCSHTFALLWLRKTALSVEIFWLSSRVFMCACPMMISSIFGKSFHFPFPYFMLSVLLYFPFSVVCYKILIVSVLLPIKQCSTYNKFYFNCFCLLLYKHYLHDNISIFQNIYSIFKIS